MPRRLLRAGSTLAGSTKTTASPGDRGVTVIVSSVPAATGFSVNSVIAAGAGPGDGAVVRNTNGNGSLPHGIDAGGTSLARYQPRGAPS